MDPEARARVESLCLEALSKDAGERAAFLDEACGGDANLRREVDSLLAGCAAADAILQTPASTASAVPLTPRTRLGPYEIQSFIGAGGMGQVYKAHDTRLGRTVAIKVLPSDLAAHPERRHRFDQEARAASALNDPHICVLHDIGSAPVVSVGSGLRPGRLLWRSISSSWSTPTGRRWPRGCGRDDCQCSRPSSTLRRSQLRSPRRIARASSIAI